jgi:vitamin B12 transporter
MPFRMSHFAFRIVAVAVAAAMCGVIYAQDLRTISGTVLDPSGRPIPRAVVELLNQRGDAVISAVTNPRGEFAVHLPAGYYRITAALAGFAPLKDRPADATTADLRLDLQLDISPIEEQIVVTATNTETVLPQVGSATTIIPGGELATAPEGVADALRGVAGLSISQSGGPGQVSSLFLRGGESKYTKVLIDGIPVNDPGGAFNFANITSAAIDRVEIVRGPQSALFGSDAVAGVVQIFTRRGSSEGLSPVPHLLIEGGTFATYRYSAGFQGRSQRLDYSADFTRSDTDNDVANGSFNEEAATGNLAFRPSSNIEIRTIFRSETGRAGVPGQWAFHRPDLDQYYRHRDVAGGVTLTYSPGVRWTQKVFYHVHDSRQFSANPVDSGSFVSQYGGVAAPEASYDYVYQTLNDTRRQIVGYQSDVALPRRHLLTAGAEFERQSGLIGDPSYDPLHATRDNYGTYVQDQWQLRNRLFTTFGVRLDHNQSYGFFAAPRASVAYHLRQAAAGAFGGVTKIRASFGQGLNEPSLIQSYSDSPFFRGNPNLRPEKSLSYDAGIDQRLGRNGTAQVTWFDNRFRDQIGFVVTDYTTFAGTFFNLGRSRARGIETSLSWEIRGVQLSGGYTLLDSKVLESTSPDPVFAKGQELFRRPRHSGFVDLRWKPSPRWTLGAAAFGVGRRVDSDYSGLGLTQNPGYGVLNLLADFKLTRGISWFAAVNNALNKQYMEVLGYLALRANFRIGLRAGL